MAWNALPPLIVRAAAPLPRVVAARAVATAPTMATSDATFEHRPDQRRFVLTTDGKRAPASSAQSRHQTRAPADG